MKFKSKTTFEISSNIVFRKQSDERFVLLEIEGERLFELDEVSAFIWELLSNNHSYSEILTEIEEEYEDFNLDNKSDVDLFLEELVTLEIIKSK